MRPADRKALVKYRISKAKTTLDEVAILLDNDLFNTAINRIYYACYYAVTALLIDNEIKTRTHSGVRQMFGYYFIKTGKINKELGSFFLDIFDKRITGDYDDFIDHEKEEVEKLLPIAKELIGKIEELLSIK